MATSPGYPTCALNEVFEPMRNKKFSILFVFFFITVLCLFGCSKKNDEIDKRIYGTWHRIDEVNKKVTLRVTKDGRMILLFGAANASSSEYFEYEFEAINKKLLQLKYKPSLFGLIGCLFSKCDKVIEYRMVNKDTLIIDEERIYKRKLPISLSKKSSDSLSSNTSAKKIRTNGKFKKPYSLDSFKVPGNKVWTKTPLKVNKGNVLLIEAGGIVNPNGWRNVDPNGYDDKAFNLYDNANHCQLIGKIGKGGRVFAIGSKLKITSQENGLLYLGINDADISNNSGSFDVDVQLCLNLFDCKEIDNF